ncbi:MAG: hypothetical protein F4077_11180 [Gammaproteobacteria bacterium]|nr:hypothetical protein [Gammaproteobacteria bacterium]
MHEEVHYQQYWREANDDDGRLLPSPYEWYDNEVEAWKRAYEWWEAAYNSPPPFKKISDRVANRYKNSSGEHSGWFARNKKKYQEYEAKEAAGTLTTNEKKKMDKLKDWFERRRDPKTPDENPDYTPNVGMDCDE